MSQVVGATPQALIDLYNLLSREEQQTFLELLGKQSPAEDPFQVVRHLSPAELMRFNEMVINSLARFWLPAMLPLVGAVALDVLRESPEATREELFSRLQARAAAELKRQTQDVVVREAIRLKQQRDRKSDPEKTPRNKEICDRRREDPKRWTYGRLASAFRMTADAVRKVCKRAGL